MPKIPNQNPTVKPAGPAAIEERARVRPWRGGARRRAESFGSWSSIRLRSGGLHAGLEPVGFPPTVSETEKSLFFAREKERVGFFPCLDLPLIRSPLILRQTVSLSKPVLVAIGDEPGINHLMRLASGQVMERVVGLGFPGFVKETLVLPRTVSI